MPPDHRELAAGPRNRAPCAHHREQRLVARAAEDDPRVSATAPQGLLHPRLVAGGRPRHHRLRRRDRATRHRVIGEVAGPRHQDVGVVQELHGLRRRRRPGRRRRAGRGRRSGDRRAPPRTAAPRSPGAPRAAGSPGSAGSRSTRSGRCRCRCGRRPPGTARRRRPGRRRPRSSGRPRSQDQLAQRREPDGSRTTWSVEDRPADGPLQRRDLLADRRLRVAEPAGRPAEGALLGDASSVLR